MCKWNWWYFWIKFILFVVSVRSTEFLPGEIDSVVCKLKLHTYKCKIVKISVTNSKIRLWKVERNLVKTISIGVSLESKIRIFQWLAPFRIFTYKKVSLDSNTCFYFLIWQESLGRYIQNIRTYRCQSVSYLVLLLIPGISLTLIYTFLLLAILFHCWRNASSLNINDHYPSVHPPVYFQTW